MAKTIRFVVLCTSIIFIGVLLQKYTSLKLSEFERALGLEQPTVVTAKERERQLECLAINIYREAGNEPFEGKVAVAQVTLNRVDHPSFPKDVCAVVYQKNKVVEKIVCQFSWYCDSKHRSRPIHKETYSESYEVAKRVLLENFRLPSLENALYYHADYVSPNWNFEKIAKIGTHIFYQPKTRGEQNAKL